MIVPSPKCDHETHVSCIRVDHKNFGTAPNLSDVLLGSISEILVDCPSSALLGVAPHDHDLAPTISRHALEILLADAGYENAQSLILEPVPEAVLERVPTVGEQSFLVRDGKNVDGERPYPLSIAAPAVRRERERLGGAIVASADEDLRAAVVASADEERRPEVALADELRPEATVASTDEGWPEGAFVGRKEAEDAGVVVVTDRMETLMTVAAS